ncbi:hypothetical protein [Agaribacterium haliotis]|uniref:hypothetical protein n=1 Tax=Agaribacterium haliotis TaxID=2013869 RepID=UPI000BB562F0|nr:hypothetical protein [Agaribacterium haliotis]
MLLFARLPVVLSALLLLPACTTTRVDELTDDEGGLLAGKTVTYSQYNELPDFPIKTAANLRSGMLDIAGAITSGNKMIKRAEVGDPAFDIAQLLGQQLETRYGASIEQGSGKKISSKKLDHVVKAYDDYDFVLDVRTLSWSAAYLPSNWKHYSVQYSALARLINVDKKTVVAEEVCAFNTSLNDPQAAPTYKELEAGPRLAQELDAAVQYCVKHISEMARFHVQQIKADMATDKRGH